MSIFISIVFICWIVTMLFCKIKIYQILRANGLNPASAQYNNLSETDKTRAKFYNKVIYGSFISCVVVIIIALIFK